jgi:FRG domain
LTGVKEITINSWEELHQKLFDNTWNENIKRHRSNFAYRGLNNSEYKLTNGLKRMGNPYPNMERNLIRQFKKYSRHHVVERDSDWYWLSVTQHHGLPTRLLDWTYSPMIAAHFATSDLNEYSKDSAIWKVNFAKIHKLLQSEFTDKLRDNNSNIFLVDDLSDSVKNLDVLDGKHARGYDIAIFFDPLRWTSASRINLHSFQC